MYCRYDDYFRRFGFPGSFQSSSGLQHSITLASLTFTDLFAAPKSRDLSRSSSLGLWAAADALFLRFLRVGFFSAALFRGPSALLAVEPLVPALHHFPDLGFTPELFLGSVLARSQHPFFRKSYASSERHQLTQGQADSPGIHFPPGFSPDLHAVHPESLQTEPSAFLLPSLFPISLRDTVVLLPPKLIPARLLPGPTPGFPPCSELRLFGCLFHD